MLINGKLWARFDAGRVIDALCGQGEDHIEERAYGGHDVLLVLGQLCDWAAERGKAGEASAAFIGALRAHRAAGRPDAAFALVWIFMTLSLHREMPFALNVAEVERLLDEAEAADGAPEALARFEGSMTKVAKVRALLRDSDGRHFDLERWRPAPQSTT